MTGWPAVGVVVPTRARPEHVRAAITAILAQDYPGPLQVAVVFDQAPPEHCLALRGQVRVLANDRTPGLAGARNTGILALADPGRGSGLQGGGVPAADLIAFCDDDDQWLPGKLRAQVAALRAVPDAEFASCGILVRSGGRTTARLAGRREVSYADLARSRMVMVHSSTYLACRGPLLDGIGLVDETIPGSQNEDWDLALRAARRRPIVHVDQPLVQVEWGSGSRFERQWETKIAGLEWMLAHHPGIEATSQGAARVYGQLAFARACQGQRAEALRWAARSARRNWHERRIPFALAVASGAISGDRVLRLLHSRGHGI